VRLTREFLELANRGGSVAEMEALQAQGLDADGETRFFEPFRLITAVTIRSLRDPESSLLPLQFLLGHGADPNRRDAAGAYLDRTPLFLAAQMTVARDRETRERALTVAKLLLAHGADPNLLFQVRTGRYPRVRTAHYPLRRTLQELGVKPSAEMTALLEQAEKRSPAEIAAARGEALQQDRAALARAKGGARAGSPTSPATH